MPMYQKYIATSDATRVKRPVLPVLYKTKHGETVLYKYVNGVKRPTGIVKSKQETVSTDTRSNYQKKLDAQKSHRIRLKYEQDKALKEGMQALAGIGKMISPSTYAGAVGRYLTGDGKLTGNILDGTGFGDTTANIVFDLAFPFAAKAGINNGKIFLLNAAPGIFDPYTTFRGSLGYYGNSLTDRILGTYGRRLHLPVKNRMPELFRAERDGIDLQNILDYENDVRTGRFPWQNTTTDTVVRDHSAGHWAGSDVVVKNPNMYDTNAYLSTQPSDTFILKGYNNDPYNTSNYTIVSGNTELLKLAREAGYETLSTPKLRDAYSKLLNKINAESDNGNTPFFTDLLQKQFRPERSDEGRNYTDIIRRLLRKRGAPTYGDYVYLHEQTGLPLTVSRSPFSIPGAKIQKAVGNLNLVFYDKSTPLEGKLRDILGIPSSGISIEERMAKGTDVAFIKNKAFLLNNLLYSK